MRMKILEILKNKGGYVSGEDMSRELGISRAAVWKHIKKLREEGFDISSVSNKGYLLSEIESDLSEKEILSRLDTEFIARKIVYINSVDSTNEEAKRHSDYPEGSLFIAENQTAGKGRLGRTWESERFAGIAMSLLLKPNIPIEKISQLTLIAGIAAARAIGGDALIKWPNDIVIGTRKVCGILTEMSAEPERVNYVVCGMGINVNNKSFPDELSDKATSVFIERGEKLNRADIVSAVMNEFEKVYKTFKKDGFAPLADEYKSLCLTVGRDVRVMYADKEIVGLCTGIDENGGLIVATNDGTVNITSGDVSVRGMYGYV